MHVRQSSKYLSLAALLACAAGTANAQVFSVSPALPIPAGAPGTTTGNMDPSVLTVSGAPASIGLMKVTFDVTHTWNADLDVVLVNPAGDKYLKLTSDNGGGGDNFANTIFVDTATASITTAPATGNISGEWRAEGGAFVAGTDAWAGSAVLPATAATSFADFVGGNANGDWTLFIYDDAGGDVGTLNSWSIEFINPTSLNGNGTATNANVCPTSGSTLITVQAIPAVGPNSTGITGSVDLSSVGGSSTQALFDNGTNGDVTAGDNIFSFRHSMPNSTTPGPQSVAWTLRDAQNRTANGNVNFVVTCLAFEDLCENATTIYGPGSYEFNLAGAGNEAGAASCGGFNGPQPDQYLRYRATRNGEARVTTCGLATFDSVIEVLSDCSTVIACDDDSDTGCGGGFSLQSEVFFPVVSGQEYLVRITSYSAAGATGSGQVLIEEAGGRLTILDAVADPDPVTEGQPVLLTVSVLPGTDPASTNLQVTGDLTELGGTAGQQFFDDGTNGDATANDNIFSYSYTTTQPDAFAAVDVVVTDGEGRTAEDTIFLEVLASPSGACCIGEGCVITRQVLCDAQGGTFGGAGTDCGGFTYEQASSSSVFEPIGGTGTSLALTGDDVGATITLPFTFRYSGTNYTEVYANSNGLLVFGGVSNAFTNAVFPTAGEPNNIVSALWDDFEIDPAVNPSTNVYFQEFGTAPNRTFVISWEKLPQLNLVPADDNNFQIVFTEGSNNLTFRYGLITSGIDANAGLENPLGTTGLDIDVLALGAGDTAVQINAVTETPAQCSGGGGGCNSIDFNGDTLFPSDEDLIDFLSVLAGGPCSTNNCGTIDFNNDGLFPADEDLVAFLRVLAGGNC
jgi:subtilisin-like proprotein convertase family protein